MFQFSRAEKALLGFIVIGLVGAFWTGWLRHNVEASNRKVEIILDGHDLVALSDAAGLPLTEVAGRLKRAGATCLAANEISLADLKARGDAAAASWGKNRLLFGFVSSSLAAKVKEALRQRLPGLQITSPLIQESPFYQRMPAFLLVEGELTGVNETGLFLDPDQVEAARSGALRLAARIPNTVFSQPKAISYSLSSARKAGVELLIFEKEEVLGYDGLIPEVAGEMKREGLTYGWLELAEQYGEEEMRRQMWDQMLRVHGISEKEMQKMTRAQTLPRLVRAARERAIRGCYLRLFLRPQADLLAYNADYTAELVRGLRGAGLSVGQARPYPSFRGPTWARFLILLGIAAGMTLLAGRLLPLRGYERLLFFLLSFIFLRAVQIGSYYLLGRNTALAGQAASLLAGLTFPTLGLLLAWQKMNGNGSVQRPTLNADRSTLNVKLLLGAIGLTIEVGLFSLIGGLFIAGMLAQTRFLVGAEQFRGVKLLLVGPVFLLALALVCGLERPFSVRGEWRKQVSESLRAFVSQPVLVGEAILLLMALGAVGILLVRSGNAPSSLAPGMEQKVRELLESVLWARPRTKEFLLGHPALFLAALIWVIGGPLSAGLGSARQKGIGALLLVAAIGQTSMVDTFCHLHTPLVFSIVRSLNGLWLGLVVGLVLLASWLLARKILQSNGSSL